MGKFDTTQDRALELIGEIGDGLRKRVPDKAMQWIETGAVRTGAKVASGFVRRNPLLAGAAVVGAGLLWYAARHRAKQAENGPIEGTATRVEAKPGKGNARTRSRRAQAAES